ncbi:MAG TPA: DNA-binding protein [Candidatus Scatovivens faecipullorum]|nr:DNA-binding protein [Candidatus Scatovivens faecipullorum]
MEYRKFDDTYVVRLNKGEEVIESLKDLCKNENIELAEITGLGASNLVEIGVFNVNTKEYNTKIFEGMFEITSLIGNATRKDGEVYLHIHINFGDEEGLVKGGHLVRSIISATSEIVVRRINGKVGRKLSNEIGLNLLEF